MWQYLHSTLCTKNACSRTYISDWRIGQISSGCSSLWVSPWICLHSASAVLLPAYGYGLHTHLPLWFPLPHIAHIFAAISFLLPLYIFRIWFACDISAQTRYGIDTATSYVLNYLCLSLDLLFYSCCDCQSPQLYYRSLFLSIVVNSLSTHSVSGCLWQCKQGRQENLSALFGVPAEYLRVFAQGSWSANAAAAPLFLPTPPTLPAPAVHFPCKHIQTGQTGKPVCPVWCARRESNPEPTASEAVTLSNCATDTYLISIIADSLKKRKEKRGTKVKKLP